MTAARVPDAQLFLAGSPGAPWSTAALPGLGGQIGPDVEDFRVEEIPAYEPGGDGPHFFFTVEKRGRSTPEVREMLARAANIKPMDIGFAGRKDANAVTKQWFSMPCVPVDPGVPDVVLGTPIPHRNKLRMGHLKGNRFEIRLRGLEPDAAVRWPALAAALTAGIPNYYGEQRFGRFANNIRQAWDFLSEPRRRVRDPDFLASVAQSAVFNRWLGARVADGLLHTVILGDVLQKRETGGLFVSTDVEADQPRVESGEVDPTGPMPGARTFAAADEAAAREAAALEALGLDEELLKVLGKFAPGTRRPARLLVSELSLEFDGDMAVARFVLPAGSFATVLLGELCRPTTDRPLRATGVSTDGD